MIVTVFQTDICWKDAKANRSKIEAMVCNLPEKPDLLVFPEMFSTGFCMVPEEVAEPEGGETLCWMQRMAKKLDCAVTGSLSVADGNYYNRMYFVFPDGSFRSYDKRHLFSFGGEDKLYTKGNERVIVEFRGFRFLLQICYDLRFPVWSRCRKDYDAVIYVANWPEGRREVWDLLLKARAIENQCYVIAANRIGIDPSVPYNGGSIILGPYGKVIAACPDGQESSASGRIGKAIEDNFRLRFPALDDADDFCILGLE